MQTYTYTDISIGMKKSRVYEVTGNVFMHFMQAFNDANPLHVDDTYARSRGFKKSVVHGAILNGFLSHFIGMEFPGTHALLQSVHIQYKAPTYTGDTLEFEAEVVQKIDALRVIIMKVKIENKTQRHLCAVATAQVGLHV